MSSEVSRLKLSDISSVVFDMDGTLFTAKHEVSPASKFTIERLVAKKKAIFIASGRPYYMILPEIKDLQISTPVVSCNGALIYSPQDKAVLRYSPIFKGTTRFIFELLVKNRATFLIYTTNQIFRYKFNKTSDWFNWLDQMQQKCTPDTMFIMEEINDPDRFIIEDHEVIKFLVIFSEIGDKQLGAITQSLDFLNDVYTVRSQPAVFDIMPKGASKGAALQELHDMNELDLDQTIAFGDADNDLTMFAITKYSVAMGQAKDEIKQHATFTTACHNDDGISIFFKPLLKLKD